MISALELVDAHTTQSARETLARDVHAGLSRARKTLPSAYFYDDRGSRLFQQITRLDEYYLTRCEREILQRHAADIADAVADRPFRLVEVGAGDGHKTEILLRELVDREAAFEYTPIDICRPALVGLLDKLRRRFSPGRFRMHALAGDYFDALSALQRRGAVRSLVLFLGSSIGNFDHSGARRFLRRLRRTLRAGDLALIGFDLKKDPARLQAAYDDSQGVTRQFNLNLLERLNRELGARFDLRTFEHRASYNEREGCMESHLVSRIEQQVPIAALGRGFHIAAGEAIHVESSYKYDPGLIERLAGESGFAVRRHFLDDRQWFVDSLWEATPG